MNGYTARRVATLSATAIASITVTSAPAAAAHGSLGCEVPTSLLPLFELLDTLTQLAFVAGIGLATLGFLTAGVFLMLPGQDNTQRGKAIAKNVLFGTILLLSANMVTAFLVSQLGAATCS